MPEVARREQLTCALRARSLRLQGRRGDTALAADAATRGHGDGATGGLSQRPRVLASPRRPCAASPLVEAEARQRQPGLWGGD